MPDLPNPHAMIMWSDETKIYVELPMTNGGFHRMEFSFCDSGITRALNLLKTRAAKAPTERQPPPPRITPGLSPTQSIVADKILERFRR